jgi:hypothetical protein
MTEVTIDPPTRVATSEGLGCNAPTVARERPILFSAPMARALLAGTKTQTRRVVKGAGDDWSPMAPVWFAPTVVDRHGDEQPGADVYGAGNDDGTDWIRCPYGAPGDRLWVREAFQRFTDDGEVLYKADPKSFDAMNEFKRDECQEARWRPSIHMPRDLSRITLEITGVRVERLQNISEADALAEGIVSRRIGTGDARTGCRDAFGLACDDHAWASSAVHAYQALWEQINGAGSWDANPWVWVVEFKRCPNLQPNARLSGAGTASA